MRRSEQEYNELIDRAYEDYVDKILFQEEAMSSLVEVKVDKSLGTITSNLDAVEASIKTYVADYEHYVVSEESVKDSKSLLADLRKQQKALDDERKQIKREWNAPFNEFEKKAKEVIALYDKPIALINNQLVKFEEDRKTKRKEEITAIYHNIKGELEEYVPLSRIYNPKWENATTTIKAIQEDIQAEFDKADMEIGTIKAMESKYEDKGLAEYKRTVSMHAAIQLMTDYRKKEEEILARQEAERKAKEERERLEAERAEQERIAAEQKAEEERKRAEEERKRAEEEQKRAEETQAFEPFALVEEDEGEFFDTVEDSIEETFDKDFVPTQDAFVVEDSEEVTVIQIKINPVRVSEVKLLLEKNNIEYEVIR